MRHPRKTHTNQVHPTGVIRVYGVIANVGVEVNPRGKLLGTFRDEAAGDGGVVARPVLHQPGTVVFTPGEAQPSHRRARGRLSFPKRPEGLSGLGATIGLGRSTHAHDLVVLEGDSPKV